MLTPFPSQPSDSGKEPIVRIIDTILAYAIKDGIREIHIVPQPNGLAILYRSPHSEEFREEMKIPLYVLGPLLKQLDIMISAASPLEIILQAQPPRFALECTVQRAPLETENGIGVALTFQCGVRM